MTGISPFWERILAAGELHAHRIGQRVGNEGRYWYVFANGKQSRKCGTEDCERLPLAQILQAAMEVQR